MIDRQQVLVPRTRRAVHEDALDRAMLMFIARFRFVTPDHLSTRFGVCVTAARRRARRLAEAGYIDAQRSTVISGVTYALTPAGSRVVGSPARRPQNTVLARAHELAIVSAVAELETSQALIDAGSVVMTERDVRRLAREGGPDYSARLSRGEHRWPDIVVLTRGRTVAFEFELTDKTGARLRRIVDGYLRSNLNVVRLQVATPRLAVRLDDIVRAGQSAARQRMLRPGPLTTRLIVEPWDGLAPDDHAQVTARLAAHWTPTLMPLRTA